MIQRNHSTLVLTIEVEKQRIMNVNIKDQWRDDFRSYGSQWGFRPGSEIDKLMDYAREEFRAKYVSDYRLRRIGKNKYVVVGGDHSNYGVNIILEIANSKKFKTTITAQ